MLKKTKGYRNIKTGGVHVHAKCVKAKKEDFHMLYIGVDLGTSAVKLLLMDGAGHIEKIV